ncbi:hypothetical protein [Rubrivirga sp.]|uniref:hypothetical protein n=1 Tax=Rubrivirga sp. TaxID=1885344 RepID=UPI003B52E536
MVRLPLLLALVLAACGPDASPPDSASPTDVSSASAEARAVAADTAMVRDVSAEGTLDLVSRDLVRLSPSVAIQTIDLWVARLDTVSADGVPDVRDELTTLRNLLQSSPLDGPAIGRTLRSLSDHTGALAEPGTPLAALAQSLHAQGLRLAPDTTRTELEGNTKIE